MPARELTVDDLQKEFGDETVLRDVDLHVESGVFSVVVGPSGCGKSTLLNCIAGLVDVDDGRIRLDGVDVTDQAVTDRDVGYVFQEFEDTLFPHKTVAENVAFGLRQQDGEVSASEIDERVDGMLELLNIEATRDNVPGELSGGQQQRVELARQLVCERDLLLLDDPLADLDYKLQKQMEIEMRRLYDDLDSTFLYVTHNQDQALKLADQLVVLNEGRVEQTGTPAEIYESPATAFVARFVGDSNALSGPAHRRDDGTVVVDSEVGEVTAAPQGDVDTRPGVVLVRPGDMAIGERARDRDNTIEMEFRGATYTGELTEYTVTAETLDREFLITRPTRSFDADPGATVDVGWDSSDALYFETLSAADETTIEEIISI